MRLATAPPIYSQQDQAQMRRALEQADGQSVKKGVAVTYLLLAASDNGTVGKLTVTSAGVLSWAAL